MSFFVNWIAYIYTTSNYLLQSLILVLTIPPFMGQLDRLDR